MFPFYFRPHAPELVVVRNSSEEEEVTCPLLRRYPPLPGLSFFVSPFMAFLLTLVARFRPRSPVKDPFAIGPSDTSHGTQSAMGDFPL
ncbi:hypothetical protein LIER_30863 [Lithospermum erythrorhizon]|uniref:Transmembrane protein n=1 Tax=Lithospermum erythrorhizon TaxID=34254 RepID=A0AAV3RSG3_LITER